MAAFLKYLLPTLLAIFCTCSQLSASPTSAPSTPMESSTPLTSHDLLNEVIRGVSVLHRQTVSHLKRWEKYIFAFLASHPWSHDHLIFVLQSNQLQLGPLYNDSNGITVRGFYAFSVLFQSFQTLNILESNNHTSTNLTILKVILDGILDDTCQWVSDKYRAVWEINWRDVLQELKNLVLLVTM